MGSICTTYFLDLRIDMHHSRQFDFTQHENADEAAALLIYVTW